MHRIARFCTALAALTLAGCAADEPVGPSSLRPGTSASGLAVADGAEHISFLSRNLYVGTDLDLVVQALASPSKTDDFPAVLKSVSELQATAWPARVVALADEIERERPHVIGLQEAWNIDVNLTPFGLAVEIHQNFLASLQAELASRGLDYVVAASVTSTAANPLPGISIVDHDVVLVDPSRVAVDAGSVVSQLFAANIGVVSAGVNILRGWVSFTATVDGVPMTIASTHLESGRSTAQATLRTYQAGQLMQSLGSASPAVLMGDFNDSPGSAMYEAVSGAGFTDSWRSMRPGVVGFTCCHDPVLSNGNARDAFSQRIDYIFARGLAHQNGKLLGTISLLGDTPASRLQGPSTMIWPSDHAGVAVRLLLPHD